MRAWAVEGEGWVGVGMREGVERVIRQAARKEREERGERR
jgi:hypothetical protein